MHASISDIVADVAANSIEASSAMIYVSLVELDGNLTITVKDNGKGMDAETCARAFDPFYTEPGKHSARKIGMGLPFVKQTCDMCGGVVSLQSEKGKGTVLECMFRLDSFDTPPMGDLAATTLSLFNYPGDFELVFTHRRGKEEYSISRSELSEAVGGFASVEGLSLARDFLRSQEEAL